MKFASIMVDDTLICISVNVSHFCYNFLMKHLLTTFRYMEFWSYFTRSVYSKLWNTVYVCRSFQSTWNVIVATIHTAQIRAFTFIRKLTQILFLFAISQEEGEYRNQSLKTCCLLQSMPKSGNNCWCSSVISWTPQLIKSVSFVDNCCKKNRSARRWRELVICDIINVDLFTRARQKERERERMKGGKEREGQKEREKRRWMNERMTERASE